MRAFTDRTPYNRHAGSTVRGTASAIECLLFSTTQIECRSFDSLASRDCALVLREFAINMIRSHTSMLSILTLFIASTLATTRLAAAKQAERPNIVFILADDLGYGDVGCYNPESKVPTPHLDALAESGMRFTDAHSPSTVCTPSRYSLLTGRMCFRTGVRGVLTGVDGPLIEPDRMTVAHLLRNAGYATACVGKWHIGMTFFDRDGRPVEPRGGGIDKVREVDFQRAIERGPVDAGFDYFFGTACCPTTDWLYAYIENDRVTEQPSQIVEPTTNHWLEYEHFRTGLTASDFDFRDVDLDFLDRSVAFLEQHVARRPNQPFFLYHATQAVHLPALPAEQYVDATDAGPLGDFIFEFDDIVGRLLTTLDRLDLSNNTLVIVSSDNGPEIIATQLLEEHDHDSARPWRGFKRDNWEGGHRVPFIARWPGSIPPGSVCDDTICLTDFFATCAAIVDADLANDAAEDSHNLLPVLSGESDQTTTREYTLHQTISNALAIRSGPWKLLDHRGSGGNDYRAPRLKHFAIPETALDVPLQLYRLDTDPGETRNLALEHPEIVSKLKSALDRMKQCGRSRTEISEP